MIEKDEEIESQTEEQAIHDLERRINELKYE